MKTIKFIFHTVWSFNILSSFFIATFAIATWYHGLEVGHIDIRIKKSITTAIAFSSLVPYVVNKTWRYLCSTK